MRARLFAAAITAACLCLSACSERGIVNSGDTDAKSSSVSSSQAATLRGHPGKKMILVLLTAALKKK